MNTPPKIVDSKGRTLLAGSENDAVDRILKEGAKKTPLLPARVKATLGIIVAVALVSVGLGLSSTSGSDGNAPTAQARQDTAANSLTIYAEQANSRQAQFPPSQAGVVVATPIEGDMWRVTARSFDGTCWQVLAYTMRDPVNPERTILDQMESVPYRTDTIHCRFNS